MEPEISNQIMKGVMSKLHDTTWICELCACLNPPENDLCVFCNSDKEKALRLTRNKAEKWTCDKCNFVNPSQQKKCYKCKISKDVKVKKKWKCPLCDIENEPENLNCRKCQIESDLVSIADIESPVTDVKEKVDESVLPSSTDEETDPYLKKCVVCKNEYFSETCENCSFNETVEKPPPPYHEPDSPKIYCNNCHFVNSSGSDQCVICSCPNLNSKIKEKWNCIQCGLENDIDDDLCKKCGGGAMKKLKIMQLFDKKQPDDEWVCKTCTMVNKKSETVCQICGCF